MAIANYARSGRIEERDKTFMDSIAHMRKEEVDSGEILAKMLERSAIPTFTGNECNSLLLLSIVLRVMGSRERFYS